MRRERNPAVRHSKCSLLRNDAILFPDVVVGGGRVADEHRRIQRIRPISGKQGRDVDRNRFFGMLVHDREHAAFTIVGSRERGINHRNGRRAVRQQSAIHLRRNHIRLKQMRIHPEDVI